MAIDNQSIAQLLADQVPALLAYWDKDLFCRFANDQYKFWFNKTADELINKIHLKELLGPEQFKRNEPYLMGVFSGQQQTFERELVLPDGVSKRHTLASYTPHIVEGEVVGFFVHVTDVTGYKELEHKLSHSNKLISSQNERLFNFANIVSHNLKNQLSSFSGIADLLAQTTLNSNQQEIVDYLKQATSNFAVTLSNLNEIVRVQNNTKLKMDNLNLRSFTERIFDNFKFKLNEIGATYALHIDTNLQVLANKAYLESILVNLVSNAIKYRKPETNLYITVEASHHNNLCTVAVNDNGVGIDLVKHGAHIFGLYQTFHQNPESSGVGLYLSKCQAEQMGGDLLVESVEGERTSFRLVLPHPGAVS